MEIRGYTCTRTHRRKQAEIDSSVLLHLQLTDLILDMLLHGCASLHAGMTSVILVAGAHALCTVIFTSGQSIPRALEAF